MGSDYYQSLSSHLNWRRADCDRVLFAIEPQFTVSCSHAGGNLQFYGRYNRNGRICTTHRYRITERRCGVEALHAFMQMGGHTRY